MLVPPTDVEALANAMERLLTNETLRREYAVAGRRHTEDRFNLWQNGPALAAQLKGTIRNVESLDGAKMERVL